MRRLTILIVVALVLTALPATAGKIGFIDAERAAGDIDEGEVRLAELQAWQAPQQARLDRLRAEVLSLRDQLLEQQGTASAEKIAEIERNQVRVLREFEDARRDYERELEARKNQALDDISKKIREIGVEYAKANDFDAVFLVGAQPMVYVSESADLTNMVIQIYNQRYPVTSR
jgi:outer membrane protein